MNKFNPISEFIKRNEIDTLVDVLLSDIDIDINSNDRIAFKNIITKLPENATLITLVNTIKSLNAKQLGLSNTTYEAIQPLLVVLSQNGNYGHYFSNSN
ncbi:MULTISPECIES: hypothetical protein [unclassified Providencia]|uniref:hypothetical protein n=1 Tax=unclassified Providencia TaxID=2633465 RepID=UPI00234A4B2B|nr:MULTISPECIES: hypothetical protein [unclassified Providencia]